MEKFFNKKYKFVGFDENFDAYLGAIGINIFQRKLAKVVNTTTELVKLNELEYALITTMPFKTHQQKFVPGIEIESESVDGRKVKNIFTIDGNKLTEVQIEPKRHLTLIKEFFHDEMRAESIIGDIRSKNWSSAMP